MTESWRTDKRKTSERGYGWKWQQARKSHLAISPLCVKCKAKGKVTIATVVDHIVPHRGDRDLFWDRSNWQSLCKPCHDIDKQAEEHGRTIVEIGLDGWPK